MMKIVLLLGVLLIPYGLLHTDAQEQVKVDIAEGAKKIDNGKFFMPARLTVSVGTTVTWTNHDDSPHTVTSGTKDCVGECWGLDFDSGILRQDRNYKFTFDKAGTYPYLCSIYPWMSGVVKVLAEGANEEVEVSVETDRITYMPGDNVSVRGNVSPVVVDQPVIIEVVVPSHEPLRAEIKVADDGIFKYNFKLEGDLAVPGSYKVKVTYSDESGESMFSVEKPGEPGGISGPSGEGGADVKIAAKRVKDFVTMRVKNSDDSGTGIYGISIEIQDSVIEAFKGPRDWSKPDTPSSEGAVTSSTSDEPIEPGGKAVFKLKVDAASVVIKWTAFDANGNVIDQGDTRLISR